MESSQSSALLKYGLIIIASIVLVAFVSMKRNTLDATYFLQQPTIDAPLISGDTSTTKPNIIFILADDLGWNSLGYDNYNIEFAAPVLAGLAASGITMKNYYAQEVCTPARASLLTGRIPLSIGMQYFMVETAVPWGLNLNETTIAEVLQADGYSTHMLGKWHIGHYSPRYLPTARGFDSYTGMLNGQSYYWSKRNPDHPHFKDFIQSDKDCYWPYEEDDLHDYSTHMYRDMAISIIEDHDTTAPLFMYLSFQAVHDPFDDVRTVHSTGIPKEYIEDEAVYEQVKSQVQGLKSQEYTLALNVLDSAVGDIVDALNSKGIMTNTYIIFSSDNGGCYGGGGKNGPLRGTKGSLFEGGVKVDAFIYSSLLPTATAGTAYEGLFHISDWFPTLLELTGTSYSPAEDFALDGVSHVTAWQDSTVTAREIVLYNYYTNVDFYAFNMWVNGSFAIRDEQYKLMHAFNSSVLGAWYQTEDVDADDDALDADVRCAPQIGFGDGDFTYWLFDLLNDPYETTNLYSSDDPTMVAVKEKLYALLPDYYSKSTEITSYMRGNQDSFEVWKAHSDYIVPYVDPADLLESRSSSYPADCYEEL